MMRFELGLERPDPARGRRSALTIGGAYVFGGLLPLLPYVIFAHVMEALPVSMAVTLVARFVFGVVKSRFTGMPALRGGARDALHGRGRGGCAVRDRADVRGRGLNP